MLHNLRPASGSKKPAKRIARGNSGKGGTTGGRGTKGQHARTGKGKRFGFEGGQVPLLRRQPKLGGFKSPRRNPYEIVNLKTLERLPEGTYTIADLRARMIVRTKSPVKILGEGALNKKISVEANAASKSAKEAVKKAGGTITIVK